MVTGCSTTSTGHRAGSATLPGGGSSAAAPAATFTPATATLAVVVPRPAVSDSFLAAAVAGIKNAAARIGGTVSVLESNDPNGVASNVAKALAMQPDVIIGLTPDALDDIDRAAASNLNQQFLIVDAQPAEPTENLTTALFDTATCPERATCADSSDIFDPVLLTQESATSVDDAISTSIADVFADRVGGIALYRITR